MGGDKPSVEAPDVVQITSNFFFQYIIMYLLFLLYCHYCALYNIKLLHYDILYHYISNN